MGLSYLGLVVPVGRINTGHMLKVARLADTYGNRDIRLTPDQNLIIPNVADELLPLLALERCCRSSDPTPRR